MVRCALIVIEYADEVHEHAHEGTHFLHIFIRVGELILAVRVAVVFLVPPTRQQFGVGERYKLEFFLCIWVRALIQRQ